VPFVTSGAARILSFRSKDPQFKTDPGVLPDPESAKEAGIDIVATDFQHTDMSDRGPDSVKQKIQDALDQFLGKEDSSALGPVAPRKAPVGDPRAMGP
jgi:tripartite-type tricarboxylate transporter receptor subunit TctC